jgi:hypothetical protein
MRCALISISSSSSIKFTTWWHSATVQRVPAQPLLTLISSTKVEVIENGTIIVDQEGNIAAVGTEAELSEAFRSATFDIDIDATGKVVLPGTPPKRKYSPPAPNTGGAGLVDGHTHPVWAGDRVHEFAMKLAGATYMDIHKVGPLLPQPHVVFKRSSLCVALLSRTQAGGGIGFTVGHTRSASEEELLGSLSLLSSSSLLRRAEPQLTLYAHRFVLEEAEPNAALGHHPCRMQERLWPRDRNGDEDAQG